MQANRSGVYALTNTHTGRVYVGSSFDITKRRGEHFSDLKTNRHRCRALQDDWLTLGDDAFSFTILEEVPVHELGARESHWLRSFADLPQGTYNTRLVAGRPFVGKAEPSTMEREEYLTVDEAAKRLKIHAQTLRKWLRDGEIKGTLMGSSRSGYRIAASEVDYVLEHGKRSRE